MTFFFLPLRGDLARLGALWLYLCRLGLDISDRGFLEFALQEWSGFPFLCSHSRWNSPDALNKQMS